VSGACIISYLVPCSIFDYYCIKIDDHMVKIWNTFTGECQITLAGHSYLVTSVGLLPDGKMIVSEAYGSAVRVWDSESGECVEVSEWGSSRCDEIRSNVVGGQGGVVKSGYDEFVNCFGVPPFMDKNLSWFTVSDSGDRIFVFLDDGSHVLLTPPRIYFKL
jgi:WD40 repeat protein